MRIQEDCCCPKCDTIHCRRSVLMLQRNLLHLSYTFMMEAGSFSEMMVHSHHTTWHHILEDSNLHSHCHENLKSHMIMLGIFWKKKKKELGITIKTSIRFDVLMPMSVMMVFWDVTPYSLVTFQRNLLSLFSGQKSHWAAGSSKTLHPPTKLHSVTSP